MNELAIFGGSPRVTADAACWPRYSEEAVQAAADLIRRGEVFYTAANDIVRELEQEYAAKLGRNRALLLNSGTSGLHSAYFGLGLQPGDEVLCPTRTFLTTVTPLFHVGAIPVLCDAVSGSGNISLADAERKIGPRTRAIVVTHLCGYAVDVERLLDLARAHDLRVIEDCSHAHGASYRGRPLGSFGTAAVLSLGTEKAVSGGTCGILLTDDDELYERACLLGQHPVRAGAEVSSAFYSRLTKSGLGLNYRVNPVCALLVQAHLRSSDERNRAIHSNVMRLGAALADIPGVRPAPSDPARFRGGMFRYEMAYVPEELAGLSVDTFVAALRAEGVAVRRDPLPPLHMLTLFQSDADGLHHYRTGRDFDGARRPVYRNGDLPVSEAFYRTTLSLPAKCFHQSDSALIDQMVQAFADVSIRHQSLLAYQHSLPAA